MFCTKTCVVIVSDTLQPVALAPDDGNTYEGVTALVSGYGKSEESKCVDPFNLYSTDKNCYYTVSATWIYLKLHRSM